MEGANKNGSILGCLGRLTLMVTKSAGPGVTTGHGMEGKDVFMRPQSSPHQPSIGLFFWHNEDRMRLTPLLKCVSSKTLSTDFYPKLVSSGNYARSLTVGHELQLQQQMTRQ